MLSPILLILTSLPATATKSVFGAGTVHWPKRSQAPPLILCDGAWVL